MANNPKRMQDPTEAALSAIQEALNVPDLDQPAPRGAPRCRPPPRAGPRAKAGPRAPYPPQVLDGDFFRPEAEPPARPDAPRERRWAANDDQQQIGQILQSIQRRPARTTYLVAT